MLVKKFPSMMFFKAWRNCPAKSRASQTPWPVQPIWPAMNTIEVLKEANGKPEHIVRLTWYVIDKQEYLGALAQVGAAYRELMGRHYPTMAVVQVSGLVEDEARLEIEATAVVPEK